MGTALSGAGREIAILLIMDTLSLLRISDPSGETRELKTETALTFIGRSPRSGILLRDPTLPEEVGLIETDQNGRRWFKVTHPTASVTCFDLLIREMELVPGMTLRLGETEIEFEPLTLGDEAAQLPTFPRQVRPWKTNSKIGRKLLWMARKAAATPLSVYIAGETGAGKEVIAHLLHAWSDRASGPFVPLHCAALPLTLIESELFGHVKGAYTGAAHHRSGALMQAHGGTLFLDEVGDLPPDIQVKILRFLENGEIKPVGSDQSARADVRLVCATHRPLRKLVEEGRFRRDLYYRLASITLELPPLRDRPEDVEHLAKEFAAEMGRSLSPRTLFRLKSYAWPGNVRELRHAVERASGMASPFETLLGESHFEFLFEEENWIDAAAIEQEDPTSGLLSLQEMEKKMMLKALKISNGNRGSAAKLLGVARSTLFEMLKRHRIEGPRSQNLAPNLPGVSRSQAS